MTDAAGTERADVLRGVQETLYTSRNPSRRWLHCTRRDRVIREIERIGLPARRRALEVGPGSGVYLPTLCRMFDAVTALDVEPAHLETAARIASEHPNLRPLEADLLTQAWPDPFDLVLCSEVLEHVPDPGAFVSGLARAVAPGGALVLSTPQPWSSMELVCRVGLAPPLIGLVRRIYREPVEPTGHISLTSRRRVRALLERAGFDILSHDRFGLYLPVIAEFGGVAGQRAAAAGERLLHAFGLGRWLLWTQLWVARRRH